MEYRYEPEGVCSQEMIIEVDGDTIKKVTIQGGCAGNTVGRLGSRSNSFTPISSWRTMLLSLTSLLGSCTRKSQK